MTHSIPTALIVHGGAGDWTPAQEPAALAGIRRATEHGHHLLQTGASALEVVEQVTMILEDDPVFDSGYGSFLNLQGEVEMDALITDGRTIDFGAVAAVRYVKNPIALAKRVLEETPHRFFVGNGAHLLSIELGMERYPNLALVTPEQYQRFWERFHAPDHAPHPEPIGLGTVGVVARDAEGNLASATSTGGTANKYQGRVGDSPLFGSGGYADNLLGAASATGHGEIIMRFLLSKYAVDQLERGFTTQQAVLAAMTYLQNRLDNPQAGLILIDHDGNLAAAHTTPAMPMGWIQEGAVRIAMHADALMKNL